MKITTKQLKQIIREELNEATNSRRFMARKNAGFDDEMMRQLDSLESSGDYEDYKMAASLAQDLGSEEKLAHKLEFQGAKMVPKFVGETIEGIQNLPTRNRIRYWQSQGVDLDEYIKDPMQDQGYWEPMHITKEQLAITEQRFMMDHLYTKNWEEYKKSSDGPVDIERFDAEWMSYAPELFRLIISEIDKHIESGKVREINGILYNPVPRHMR